MKPRRRSQQRFGGQKSFHRGPPSRKPAPIVLIVCEGEATEPTYFERLRVEKHLPSTSVEVIPGSISGSHPKSITAYAKKRKNEARVDRVPYDVIWCVFDRDEHTKIEEAFQQARENGFKLAFSNPCFELWYLLHFADQGASIGRDEARRKLETHVADYTKSKDMYETLLPHQQSAIERAERLRSQHQGETAVVPPNPSTSVDELVSFLNALSAP